MRYEVPQTPSTTSDEAPTSPGFAVEPQTVGAQGDDADPGPSSEARGALLPIRKPGGYDSRVEQMLYEDPDVPILITDAGKSTESGGKFIVYTIRTGVRQMFWFLFLV